MLTREEIIEKAEWLEGQFEKNKEILEGINTEDYDFQQLANEYLHRIKEAVSEYKRLASEYVAYKTQVQTIIESAYFNLVSKITYLGQDYGTGKKRKYEGKDP